jgi:muramidase (phage lysozyme)
MSKFAKVKSNVIQALNERQALLKKMSKSKTKQRRFEYLELSLFFFLLIVCFPAIAFYQSSQTHEYTELNHFDFNKQIFSERIKFIENSRVKAFLDLIAFSEGTHDKYNISFGHSKFTSFKDHPRVIHCQSGYCSDAAGRYQFLSGTWKAISKKHSLKDFSPKNQDLAAIEKIKERGAYQLIVNDEAEKAIYKLSKEWSSFPTKSGKSYYSQPSRRIDKLVNFYESKLDYYLSLK